MRFFNGLQQVAQESLYIIILYPGITPQGLVGPYGIAGIDPLWTYARKEPYCIYYVYDP